MLLLLLSACSSQEQIIDDSYKEDFAGISDSTANGEPVLNEMEPILSEKEQLQELFDLLTPITDYSLMRQISDFYGVAVSAALSTEPESAVEQLSALQSEIAAVLDTVVAAEPPVGYAVQDDWKSLSGSCLSLRSNINSAIKALQDNDSSRVLELMDSAGSTDAVEEAMAIQNVLAEKIDMREEGDKLNIQVSMTYDECLAKAAKYARYYFKNPDIKENDLAGDQVPVVLDDVPGKHYSFTLNGNGSVIILISVEDCSIICREITPDGFRDNYVNDGELPAEGDDAVMPDIIGMNYEEAKALLDSMGIQYDGGGIDTDLVPEGTVAHCYPSPGNAVPDGYVVSIAKEIDADD